MWQITFQSSLHLNLIFQTYIIADAVQTVIECIIVIVCYIYKKTDYHRILGDSGQKKNCNRIQV